MSIQYIMLQYNQVQIRCMSAGSLAAQWRSVYMWSLFTVAFFPPWPCVHVYAFCQYLCLYLCLVSSTEGASVLITSSHSGFHLEWRLLPDQLSHPAKDENGRRLQSHWKAHEDKLRFFSPRHIIWEGQSYNTLIQYIIINCSPITSHHFQILPLKNVFDESNSMCTVSTTKNTARYLFS